MYSLCFPGDSATSGGFKFFIYHRTLDSSAELSDMEMSPLNGRHFRRCLAFNVVPVQSPLSFPGCRPPIIVDSGAPVVVAVRGIQELVTRKRRQ